MHFAGSGGTDLPSSSAPNPQTVPRGGRSHRDHGKAFALQTPGKKKSDHLILSLKTHHVNEAGGKSKLLGFKFVWVIVSLLELKTLGGKSTQNGDRRSSVECQGITKGENGNHSGFYLGVMTEMIGRPLPLISPSIPLWSPPFSRTTCCRKNPLMDQHTRTPTSPMWTLRNLCPGRGPTVGLVLLGSPTHSFSNPPPTS